MEMISANNGDIYIQNCGITTRLINRFSNKREKVMKYRVVAKSFSGESQSQYCYGSDHRDRYIQECKNWLSGLECTA